VVDGAQGASEAPLRRRSRLRRGKAKWDPQPTQPAEVLVATIGIAIPPAVIGQACQLSGGRAVAVLTIARMYGSALGLQNPGLLPSKREMAEQRALVADAIESLERAGIEAWGQVATTRRYARTIVQSARAHGVTQVLVVAPAVPRWRSIVEGDTARDVKRRIGKTVVVESIAV
jgi:hypothetical protein